MKVSAGSIVRAASPRAWVLLPAVLSILLVSATAAASPPPAPASAPAIRWQTCPPFELPARNMECGTLTVPVDYADPGGTTVQMAVSRLPARRPAVRRGVLVLNPGGPGGAGLDMPLWMVDLLPQSVLDRYDLIGFDPRGVGHSAPVSCGLSLEDGYEIAPPFEQPGGFDATAAFMASAADGCARVSGNFLPFVSTANTARDIERLRQALGAPRISYYGLSYGTYLGAVYATLFPDRVDRFVLDSAADPRAAWREFFRSWGLADESRFPDFARFLIANETDYDLGGTEQEVRANFFRLMEQADRDPIPFPDGIVLDGPWFRVLTFAGLYSDSLFADTARIWRLIDQRRDDALVAERANSAPMAIAGFPSVPDDNAGAATLAVLCGDSAWPRSVEQYRQELTADATRFPLFGVLGSNIWACAFWATDPLAPPVAAGSDGAPNQILVVHNLRDPATPYAEGIEMRSALGARARLLTVDQGGHGASYGEENECAKQTVTDYLVAGVFPSSDTTCPAESDAAALTAAERSAIIEVRGRTWLAP